MTLKVIGPGFGRTGTKSLKEALEILGFGPCHHMYEVVDNQDQIPKWVGLANGKPLDWNEVFNGYNSQIDWPGAHYWRSTISAFPNAKVVMSVRPAELWWKSFDKTIGKLMEVYPTLDIPPFMSEILDMNVRIIGQGTFSGKWRDKDTAIEAFNQRLAEVKAEVPAERLLVFDVAEGWDPLCAFLGVDVPDQPFPHHNLRADFWEVVGGEPA